METCPSGRATQTGWTTEKRVGRPSRLYVRSALRRGRTTGEPCPTRPTLRLTDHESQCAPQNSGAAEGFTALQKSTRSTPHYTDATAMCVRILGQLLPEKSKNLRVFANSDCAVRAGEVRVVSLHHHNCLGIKS